MSPGKDWNAIFAERKAERDAARAEMLRRAKAAAVFTDKQPFDRRRFETLYRQLNPDDVDDRTPWETLLIEAEYDYYVSHPEIKTLEAFIEQLKWLQGWG